MNPNLELADLLLMELLLLAGEEVFGARTPVYVASDVSSIPNISGKRFFKSCKRTIG